MFPELRKCAYLANKQEHPSRTLYVDANGQIAGRLCSKVAKLLLTGSTVTIVNADKALLSGFRQNVLKDFLERLAIASVVHPKHGPFHPRTPSGILTRMVRGMIPRTKPIGAASLKRLRVYEDVPEKYGRFGLSSFEEAKATKPLAYYVPLGEVARRIGWKGE